MYLHQWTSSGRDMLIYLQLLLQHSHDIMLLKVILCIHREKRHRLIMWSEIRNSLFSAKVHQNAYCTRLCSGLLGSSQRSSDLREKSKQEGVGKWKKWTQKGCWARVRMWKTQGVKSSEAMVWFRVCAHHQEGCTFQHQRQLHEQIHLDIMQYSSVRCLTVDYNFQLEHGIYSVQDQHWVTGCIRVQLLQLEYCPRTTHIHTHDISS